MIATLAPPHLRRSAGHAGRWQAYEIIEGELIVNPAPTVIISVVSPISTRILEAILCSSDGWGGLFLMPVDLYLGYHDIVQPDLVVIRTLRSASSALEASRVEGHPHRGRRSSFPSTRRMDLVRKMALYARSGVPEYWVADPEQRTLVVNSSQGEAYVDVAA